MNCTSDLTLCSRRVVTGLTLALLLGAGFSQAAFAQPDPVLGRWVFNPAKSSFTPPPSPFRSATLNYQADGQAMKNTVEGVDSDGKPVRAGFTIIYDGKPYPVTGVPDYDASSFKRTDANTVEFTRFKGGKSVSTGRRVLSRDGKTLTFTESGVNAKGQKYSSTAVYERQ